MKIQTSSEWLEDQIYKLYIKEDGQLPYFYVIELIQQAKEMLRLEIIAGYARGNVDITMVFSNLSIELGEKYYKNTYTNENTRTIC